MIGASVKRCPDCGGSGKGPIEYRRTMIDISRGGLFGVIDHERQFVPGPLEVIEGPCPRCNGAGAALILDVQLDDEFPRHEEESNGNDD
jgi:DnaJ-class molecular chaperone